MGYILKIKRVPRFYTSAVVPAVKWDTETFKELVAQNVLYKKFDEDSEKSYWEIDIDTALKNGHELQIDEIIFGCSKKSPGKFFVKNKTKKCVNLVDTIGEMEAFVASGAIKEE